MLAITRSLQVLDLVSSFNNSINLVVAAASSDGGGFFDLTSIIKTVGLIGVVAIVFAESGLLIGFFLPGDSLLFTAGFLASQKIDGKEIFNIWLLVPLCFLAAVLGDNVGYWFGKKVGPRLFNKEDSLFFSKQNLYRAQAFYEKNGGKTILLARFLPVVRTFAPIVAGVGKMKYSAFIFYNVIGGFLWAVGVTLAGYFLGSAIPDIDKFLLPIIILIILLSIAPTAYHILKDPHSRQQLMSGLQQVLNRKKKAEATKSLEEVGVGVEERD
jgi:membrane-associated protein